MTGLSRETFRKIPEDVHLAQSIEDILSTPVGTRVLRRDYGSGVPDLIDRPLNGETVVDLYMAVADALDRWEPRFRLTRVQLGDASAGRALLLLEGKTENGTLSVTASMGGGA